MWTLTYLILAATINLTLLQNSTPIRETQNSTGLKPGTSSGAAATGESTDLAATVAATTPVITIRRLCAEGAPEAANGGANLCSRPITREQFEILVNALNPDGRAIPPTARRNLGKTYADYLAVDAAARSAGMEDTAEFRALMEFVRLRAVADFYRHRLEEQYRTPSPAEIDAYYHQHLADYERVRLARILVPRENPSAPDKDQADQKAREAARIAQARALKGDDPTQIQNDTYAALGLASPPPADLGNRRRAEMLAEEAAEVFALKTGEISQVETELKSYVIYKVLSKDKMPIEEVKADISREIYQQKFREAMKSVLNAFPTEFNEQYFGPATAPSSPRPPIVPDSRPAH